MSEFRKVLNEEEEKIMKKKIITKKVKKRWLFHSFDVYIAILFHVCGII